MLNVLQDYLSFRRAYKAIINNDLFDREYYLRNNLDVARACVDPIKHYLREGWRQGKNPNPYFDTAWYLEMYPDVKESGSNPLYHYLTAGWKQGYDPSPRFSINKYVSENPDLANIDAEPLCRFLQDQKAGPEVIDLSQLQSTVDGTEDFGKVAVHAHIYYTDLIGEFVEYINHVPGKFDCFFTTDTVDKKKIIQETVGDSLNAQKFQIRVTPNIGRDVAPFAVGCRDILSDYDTVCHIHTKKALHTSHNDYGNTWRKNLLAHLLGGTEQVRAILSYFRDNPDVGLLFPTNFIPIQKYLESDINQWNMEYLAKRIGLRAGAPREIICPAGSMFWAKTKSLRNLLDAKLSYSEFDNEAGQLDGTLAHAFERLFVYIAKDNGFSSRVIGSTLN